MRDFLDLTSGSLAIVLEGFDVISVSRQVDSSLTSRHGNSRCVGEDTAGLGLSEPTRSNTMPRFGSDFQAKEVGILTESFTLPETQR